MFISQRIMHPYLGKSELAIDRVHRMAGILSRHGAKTRIGRVTAGAGAGEIHFMQDSRRWQSEQLQPRIWRKMLRT